MRTYILLSLFLLPVSVWAVESSQAFNQDKPYFYMGAQVSGNEFTDSCTAAETTCDDQSVGYGLYYGYRFNNYFSIEHNLLSYGEISSMHSENSTDAKTWGSELSSVFFLPVFDKAALYTKIGGAYTNIEKKSSTFEETNWHGVNLLVAVGTEYQISNKWSVRGEYKFIDGVGDKSMGKADLQSISLGLSYRFVENKPFYLHNNDTTQIALEPKAPNNKSEREPIAISHNVYFRFDSSALEYSSDLKEAAIQLTKNTTGQISIVGYSDSIGSDNYNLRLSRSRATTVANYLIKMGISQTRISVKGMGATSFKSTNETIGGRAMNRRVEIQYF